MKAHSEDWILEGVAVAGREREKRRQWLVPTHRVFQSLSLGSNQTSTHALAPNNFSALN